MRIAYVGLFRVHEDNASLQRVVGIAQSLQHAGHEVLIAGGDSPSRGARDLTPELTGIGTGDADPNDPMSQKVARFWRAGDQAIRWLESLAPSPDCVILYGGGAPFANRVRRWCRRIGASAAVDLVEWYDGSHMPLGRFGPFALQNGQAMRHNYPRMRNVIAISSYLERYYRARGCSSVRVPPTLDVLNREWSTAPMVTDGRLKLVYAGTPGKKDLLGPMLQGLQMVDPSGSRLELEVIGMDHAALQRVRETHHVTNAATVAIGRVSRETAMAHVSRAAFVPLLRSDARYAHAGFPTKLVESMSLGTPMICNLTSDIGDHVVDGETGIVVDGSDAGSFAIALERVAAMSTEEVAALRAPTRKKAEEAFDYRAYAEPLDRWIRAISADRASPER